MTGRIERIEREGLAAPVGQQLDELALLQQAANADRLDAGDADAREAGAEQRAGVGDEQASAGLHGLLAATLAVFPFAQRLAGQCVSHLEAFVRDEIGRFAWPPVLPDVSRGCHRDHARLEQLACDER